MKTVKNSIVQISRFDQDVSMALLPLTDLKLLLGTQPFPTHEDCAAILSQTFTHFGDTDKAILECLSLLKRWQICLDINRS